MRTKEHERAIDALHECDVKLARMSGEIEGIIRGVKDDPKILKAVAKAAKSKGVDAARLLEELIDDSLERHLPQSHPSGSQTQSDVVDPAVAKFRRMIA